MNAAPPAATQTNEAKPTKAKHKVKLAAREKQVGRGNTGSDTLYLGIRNIRRTAYERARNHAKSAESNVGTVISDALDQYLKRKK